MQKTFQAGLKSKVEKCTSDPLKEDPKEAPEICTILMCVLIVRTFAKEIACQINETWLSPIAYNETVLIFVTDSLGNDTRRELIS